VRRYEEAGVPTNGLRFVDTTGAGTGTAGFEAGGATISEASGSGTGPDGGTRVIGAQAPVERFSDNPPDATSISISPRAAGRVLASRNQNSISVTVLDQYGNPFRGGAAYTATNAGPTTASQYPGNDDAVNSGALTSNSGGRIYFNYNYRDNQATETVTVTDSDGTTAGTATVFWSNISDPGSSAAVNLLLADPSSRRLIASVDDAPTALPFGADDTFLVGQGPTPLSLAQFQEVLMVAVSSDSRITLNADPNGDGTVDTQTALSWEGFNNNRPNDRATWTLQGLRCTPPPGADAETYGS